MAEFPTEFRYLATHEWAKLDGEVVVVGISDHAQDALGDVVYVELPEVGATFAAGDEAAVVESVKAASDIFAPVSGSVVEVNVALEDEPELVNDSAYVDGWFFKLSADNPAELEDLLSAEGYRQVCESEEH
ncbi:MAG: glycine cleavage system protein GcvH [Gammaproteobacteria bacterium]|jgi:glycine cleavage system H protein|nr:glycine cleavage system protein GcvH [Gammaproteobacteria bacterium]MBT4494063.1 glycine cleavage system protein GcvH [Gammaproteobacteria bacterium]MBT7371660.1 glycine cleavage system protein GcvH [Gammaproteobacteria bacterium]